MDSRWKSGGRKGVTTDAVGEATWKRVRTAPGRHKHLIIGNHDVIGSGEMRAEGFDDVRSVMTTSGDPPLLGTHYPLLEVPEKVREHRRTHARGPTE